MLPTIGVATVSQRGQVVIPKKIRDLLGIQTADKIIFEVVEENKIALKPALSLDDAMGMIKAAKSYTEKDYRRVVRQAVVEKYSKK